MDTDQAALQRITSHAQLVTSALVKSAADEAGTVDPVAEVSAYLKEGSKPPSAPYSSLVELNQTIVAKLAHAKSFFDLSEADRRSVRTDVFLVDAGLGKLVKTGKVADPATKKLYADYMGDLDRLTKYIPAWVKVAVAIALGLGTMIGWKRIVVTVGEKIGKTHLTYAQGASAELVAMFTIGAADHFGLPVSTTHVLSSGVAGTMLANHSGLQTKTLRNLLLAWVLTLPVCIFLGAALFSGGLFIVLNFAR
jgi:PiT family inorganic phosphate transporter